MPTVSIIVPCYNEEKTIRLLLEALCRQTYPLEAMEVVIADGLSTDRTLSEIHAFQQAHPNLTVHVIQNTRRSIPAALNAAIAAASGEYVVRLDAHSVPYPDYVERCVRALHEGLGQNVGGVWEIRPAGSHWIARSIAASAAHPLGVGDAHYRFTQRAQYVDTVPFGAFRRDLFNTVGSFDESLLSNEDYEFNVRIRQNNGKIWLDPAIRSTYFARASLPALGRQYWRYGYWKAQMLRRYPGTIRWRQIIPPFFVASLVVLSVLALFWSFARWLLLLELAAYFLALFSTSAWLAWQKRDPWLWLGIPLAISIMHFTWGAAFLWSTLRSLFQPAE